MTNPHWSLELSTPIGEGALTLTHLEGEEFISQPFLFHLTMSGAPVEPAALLGKPAHVTLRDGEGNERHLHGLVTRLHQSGGECRAELRPWLWTLSLASDNRIFQQKSVPDILAEIFNAQGFTDHRNDLRHTYPPLPYCVQFQESDFAFASRLMEEAGIFYFFDHTASAHTLVLGDDPASFTDCANAATLPYLPLARAADWLTDRRIEDLSTEAALTAAAYQSDDFNFTTPSTRLKVTTGTGTRRLYEYPGRFATRGDGEDAAARRIEELESPALLITGASPVRALRAGGAFTLTNHPDKSLNARYALRSVAHTASRREYANRFTAFPASTKFRPPRATPRPRIGGSQTAIVTGPPGKEIYTDQYGRVKLQFHWDQLGKHDENSSCWVRVAQNWAGTSWGAFTLPRIGQEVVVTFIDADPDRPLVTGCVYNGDNPVPYPLPDNQTRTTLKSNSSEGGNGFNEIRLEDKAGSEELYIHAQKDMTIDVLNDQTSTVTQNRAATISKGNESLTVTEGDRTIAVSKGKETHSVAGTRTLTVTGAETHTNKADYTQKVAGNFTLTVDGDITIKATGSLTLQSGLAATMKAATSLTLEGGTTTTLKASAAATIDGGGMLELKGGMIKLN